ncbi:MAG: element excision factor XisH family protein [Nostoc sp. CmiVER01]|uniref:element excision factor XisH family protein n=1 Tax=Nostoc sp. CmiVER01 TaxID=3075384 RepID=UPI002AD268FE|nr:element excision factor XisH family protein [Nostoc sp. CmiVER01]MDZ8125225.1 element excision factor XisH family protein [Nostoc sp. CmiVER01]
MIKSTRYHFSNILLGQFINYRGALRRRQPKRVLYLAVPLTIYKTFFQLDFPKEMIAENQVKMLIYDVEQEVIFQWRN